MPDWVAHVLVAYISCTVLSFKYKQFNTPYTVIAMIGSLIPDIFKIYIPLETIGIYMQNIIVPLHLPIGSLIVVSIIALFFREKKLVFLFLIFGVITHYILDSFLIHLNGGMPLLFPFSWAGINYGIIPVDDYYLSLITIVLAIMVYATSRIIGRKRVTV
ncbi:MAG: metal-dependent hydrolase [Methanobacterium sp.]